MTQWEIDKIGKLITQLDTVVGKLIIPAMNDKLVKESKEQVSRISFELGNLL